MKEAFVDKNISLTIRDTDIPVPEAGQVLIRVVVSGTNPKDWKIPPWWPTDGTPTNQGDDIAGYIEAVGEGVVGFHKGDKVAAFHQVMKPHGSYAEYAIAPDYTTFHIPAKTGFEGEPVSDQMFFTGANMENAARGGHYSASCYDSRTRALSALEAASALESDH
jgi:NADPH:quinone reductase-like Zn-dependent oxidoreductase